jgi:large subunit ribosomal protein L10
MALSKARKHELVAAYEQGLAAAPHAYLLAFKGVTVPQVTELRSRVRKAGGRYVVVKNSLALRAVEGGALRALAPHFDGPTAVAYTHDDPVALAKALTDFVKEVPAIAFKAAVIEGTSVAAAQIQEIAQLPRREELVAKLLFLLQSPISRFVRVLGALPRQLVVVMDQVRREKEKTAGAESA